jgi:hypothetical protein
VGTELVAGLAGGVVELGGVAGVDAGDAPASGCCGVRGVSGMKTGADLRLTGGGEEVNRSMAVGEREGPVGGRAEGGRESVSGWLAPKAGGSGPVAGRNEVGGA